MAPVFAHGQLRLYLLSLLESGPKHGYELITALSARFGGTYRPSPGTVYPRLARLEEEGLVRRSEDGRKSTYALTDEGRRELKERGGDLANLEAGIAETVRGLAAQVRAEAQGTMAGLRADLAAAAQQARAGARQAPAAQARAQDGAHSAASRVRRAETEVMLQRFRDDLRAELRRAEASHGLDQLTVDTLRTVLASAREAVRATLPPRGGRPGQ